MSKTTLSFETVMSIANEAGLQIDTHLKSFVCIHNGQGSKGERFYVPKLKNVSFIDLSAFTLDTEQFGVRDLGGDSFGNVHQKLRFDLDASKIVENWRNCCLELKSRPPIASNPRKHVEKKNKENKVSSTNNNSNNTNDSSNMIAAVVKSDDPATIRRSTILAMAKQLMDSGVDRLDAIKRAQDNYNNSEGNISIEVAMQSNDSEPTQHIASAEKEE